MQSSTKYYCIGLMSGTSLDGLDIVYCHFEYSRNKWDFEIIAAKTIAYSDTWRNRFMNARSLNNQQLKNLDLEYGCFLADNLESFIAESVDGSLDLIASHGHTIFHQPERKYTLQIGSAVPILERFGIPVINDFRIKDVQLGGQGAPLVPIGDKLLFSEYDACINLGGFMNISMDHNGYRIAMDVCPLNVVFNHLARKRGLEFDNGGRMAEQGRLDKHLLDKFNNLLFYKKLEPRSLGQEWVDENILPILNISKQYQDQLNTWTFHAVEQLKTVLNHYNIKGKLLMTGGGVHNKYFMSQLKNSIGNEFIVPNDELIDFKEALIFAFLGVLNLRKEVNTLASVTGASSDSVGGVMYQP